jgi:hypothetical protein
MSAKRSVYVASAIVIPLTLLQYQSQSSSNLLFSLILFLALFPGMAVQMLITGGHGGTMAQETLAAIIGPSVNIIAYSLLCWGAAKVFHKFVSE